MVDISMTDGALSWLAMVAGRYFGDGEVPRARRAAARRRLVCYLPYEAADGWVTCGALEPKFWARVLRRRRRPDLIEKQFEPPGSDGLARGRRGLQGHAPATSGRPSTTSTTAASSRSSTSTRRSTRSWSGSARWWSSSSSRSSATVRQLGVPVKLSPHAGRRSDPPGAGARRAHRRRCCARPATREEEIAGAGGVRRAQPGPSARSARQTFLRMSAAMRGRATARPAEAGRGAAADGRAGRGLRRLRPRRSSTTCARACCPSRSRPAATWPTTRPSSSSGSS